MTFISRNPRQRRSFKKHRGHQREAANVNGFEIFESVKLLACVIMYTKSQSNRQALVAFPGKKMKKLKNEKELIKKAIEEGVKYGEKRGVVEFEPTDSAHEKIEYIYRLLVHDKVIQPIPEIQVSQKAMAHKLAIWASRLK